MPIWRVMRRVPKPTKANKIQLFPMLFNQAKPPRSGLGCKRSRVQIPTVRPFLRRQSVCSVVFVFVTGMIARWKRSASLLGGIFMTLATKTPVLGQILGIEVLSLDDTQYIVIFFLLMVRCCGILCAFLPLGDQHIADGEPSGNEMQFQI